MLIKQMVNFTLIIIILSSLFIPTVHTNCHKCYIPEQNTNCNNSISNKIPHTLHMSVHPHLDAFWIYDFSTYYDIKSGNAQSKSYFASNRFTPVKSIFNTALSVLLQSKKLRQTKTTSTQNAHRSFFNSQIGFFKKWYFELAEEKKKIVRELLQSGYWQIVGGGYVQHDEGCAYYDDIIENFQNGLRFLKQQFGYGPRVAISSDSFGHSQSTLAILAHLGMQGFLVERSDQHILLKNKTQFIWKAKSSNNMYYGALPTHIRWAIHGFQDQFIPRSNNPPTQQCISIKKYLQNLKNQNQFLKHLIRSTHIIRYFGHDFQQFNQQSYQIIQTIMEQFSMQKCRNVIARYGNPTQYFIVLMSQVFEKVKALDIRSEDIMPIWDFDSGLYWTGYYTTDPYHKKIYRDAGRYLIAARKLFIPSYITTPNSNIHRQHYRLLQQFAETVSYLQHHDGITGTSKYHVLDQYEKLVCQQMNQINEQIFKQVFQYQFAINTTNNTFSCTLESQCHLPPSQQSKDIYLKIFKTGGSNRQHQPIIIHLQPNQFYQPNCQYQLNCFCTEISSCPCDLYLYHQLTFTYTLIQLKKVNTMPKNANYLQLVQNNQEQYFKYNDTHITIRYQDRPYHIGYKKIDSHETRRNYQHLNRYGNKSPKTFIIRSGKYALGNNIKTLKNLSRIKKIFKLEQKYLSKYVVLWTREQMKTVITIPKNKKNQWKVQTISAAEAGRVEDLYLQINAPHIKNDNKFYTDSNGWLVMKRQLFKHQDYQPYFSKQQYDDINGNSYPMTSFTYIVDKDNINNKISVNTDRPQGVISYLPGTIWINYDRLTDDDGKWVYEKTFRAQYQKFVHYITVNGQNNQRILQKLYDEPLIIQGNSINQNQKIQTENFTQNSIQQKWQKKIGINKIKFYLRPFNDSSLLFQIHNLKDYQNTTIQLFSFAQNISTFLTYYYGNTIRYQSISQTNLGGNMQYQQFIAKKWNWYYIVNLQTQNNIFTKQFQEIITLNPLEIRTFILQGVTIDIENCQQIDKIQYTHKKIIYQLDSHKDMPMRSTDERENQNILIKYLLEQDHCNVPSPVKKVSNNSQTSNQSPQLYIDHHKIMRKIPKNIQNILNVTSTTILPDNVIPPQSSQFQPDKKHHQLQILKTLISQRKPLNKQQKIMYFENVIQKLKEGVQSFHLQDQ